MRPIPIQCTVTGKRSLTPTVYELDFVSEPEFSFKAGQFVSVVVPGKGPGGRDIRRAYSIASAPEHRPVQLCIKLLEDGPGSNYLNDLKIGDPFKAFAPYGDFVLKTPKGRSIVFVATGTGIAPFRSMVLSKDFDRDAYGAFSVLFGAREESEQLYTAEMSKALGAQFVMALTKAKPAFVGYHGRVTNYLRAHLKDFDLPNTDFYLCGNGGMITEVKEILMSQGVPKTSVHQEIYYK